jgi:type VI secretion system protein ImpJ
VHDPARTREVLLGRPNLLLLRGDEPREQFLAVKLAELLRQGDGSYALIESFIPPVCRLSAAPALRQLLQAVSDQVGARVRALGERRARFGGVADFGPNELGQFLLLQTLRPALVMLQHFQANSELHPEWLYRELARLVSSLIGFQPEAEVGELPPYAHQDLTATFSRLHAMLRTLLGDVMPAQMSGLKLQRESDALYSTHSIDGQTLDHASLFLAVLFESEDPSWVTDFGRQAKVGAREDIELILSSALGGVRLVHTQRTPNRLPIKSGYEYFRIEPKGDFWARVREHQSLAFFLPGKFTAAKIELLSVDE